MKKIDCNLERIRDILPHRPPFLFVDRVVELEADKAIRAERELRADEPHCAGHFPGDPITPGVLITEALAQTAGLLIALSSEERGEDARGQLFYLVRADMKWTSPTRPGEVLQLEARLVRTLGALWAFRVSARTRAADVASGTLTLARVGDA